MKEHIKRRIEFSKDAIPEEGTDDYDKTMKFLERQNALFPEMRKATKKNYKIALNTLEAQFKNGIGFAMDNEIRHYLTEFNSRSWNFGHRKMPLMFNILESFFHLDKSLNYWTLLGEEDYVISFFDFIDFYTSNEFKFDVKRFEEELEEDLIYHYNVGADIKELTFKTKSGKEFVIGGVSLVRRGREVSMLFLTGEVTDTHVETKRIKNEVVDWVPTKGKEKLRPDPSLKREAVQLNGDSGLWKVLVACRFDLETETTDARYVAKDKGDVFSILTDDIEGFAAGGKWRSENSKETYESLLEQIKDYDSIFELAKAVLYLPFFVNHFDDRIVDEEHDTTLKSVIISPITKRKFREVDDRFKIRTRSLWLLDLKEKFSPTRINLRDDKFKVDKAGYWKKLEADQVGTDKKGRQVTGKTWVNRTDSYYMASTDELIISTAAKVEFEGENVGYIYIMRNSSFHKDVYKIGLTRNSTDERASQLSKTSTPDKFYVMREWLVQDCVRAEKEIHFQLDQYRVDVRREFFKLDMKIANNVIDEIIDKINPSHTNTVHFIK